MTQSEQVAEPSGASAAPNIATPSSKTDPSEVMPPSGQLILGTDKRNPVFTVYEDESGQRLSVFYGFERIEVVRNDAEDPAFKMLIGRLYNCGVKLGALCQSFTVDPKTVRRWAQALEEGDPEQLLRVLAGRHAGRKLTSEVEKFARLRWPDLVGQRSYGAVGRLQGEIESVFAITLSRSTMSGLIQRLQENPAPVEATPPPQDPPDRPTEPSPTTVAGASTVHPEVAAPIEVNSESRETVGQSSGDNHAPKPLDSTANPQVEAVPPVGNIAQGSPFFPRDPAPSLYWCDHAGVLIFASTLAAITRVGPVPQGILAQWMAALWLGAQNIEQTKYLNWEDMQLILGGVVRFPTPQREQLKALADDPELIDALWRFNQQSLGPAVGTDFYFDPHTKHYTGEQAVLKGWCPKIRFADKVLHSDFIDTTQGPPIYFETTDNFADLRQRFGEVIGRARQALQWPVDFVPTYIVDRGIFGAEPLEQAATDPTYHLITWEKGFAPRPWDPTKVMGKTTLTRTRNNSTDLRHYQFEYFEQPWAKNPKLRQIVVQATDDRERVIQVAILTEDLTRAAAEIIEVMFRRWLQENDFKYLDKHFGINQITSYRVIEYEKLKEQVKDRQVKSGARRALEHQLKQVTTPLQRHLLAEEQARHAHQLRATQRPELEAKLAQESSSDTPQAKSLRRQLALARTADQRYETARLARRKLIEQGTHQVAQLRIQIDATQAKESRVQAMIQTQMVKLDGQCKRLFDLLKISARNLFYQALQPFKAAYDNYRDDHDHFRNLTHSPGVLEVSSEQITVHLMPRTAYGGELRSAVLKTLEGLNAAGLDHPCLPGRKLKFRLGQRSEMDLKMNVVP